jgi:NAD(P)-dependent dehydrogenase (short-subunit alcohol dehydrogenase family)
MTSTREHAWALILGASSGFGAAIALELARRGFDIFGVHLDRRDTLPAAHAVRDQAVELGRKASFFNVNAGDDEARTETIQQIAEQCERSDQRLRVLVHSIAFGSLKAYFAEGSRNQSITKRGMEMTLDLMANTLVYWTQDLVRQELIAPHGRVFALTSSGSHRVWYSYGAVSAAKAALESHMRQLALELAPHQITCNSIQAGVTDTPALRKIPGHEEMIEMASRCNPHKELTTVERVARAIGVLCDRDLDWMTGNVIRVDGGEDIVG